MARTFDADEGKKQARKRAEAVFDPNNKKPDPKAAKSKSKGTRSDGKQGDILPADAPSGDGLPTVGAIRHYMSELVKFDGREATMRGQLRDITKKKGEMIAEAEAAGIPRKVLKRLVEDDGVDQGAALEEEREYRRFATKANVQIVMAFQEAPTLESKDRVDREGYEAGLKGQSPSANPHMMNSSFFNVWEEARLRGQKQLVDKFNGQSAPQPKAKAGPDNDKTPPDTAAGSGGDKAPVRQAGRVSSPAGSAAQAAGIAAATH